MTSQYIVKEGDSLWKISQANKVSIKDLQVINNLDGNDIRPGQRLFIHSGPSPKGTKTIIVVAGDSLWQLSQTHSVSIEAIKKANGLTGNDIEAGSSLKIPYYHIPSTSNTSNANMGDLTSLITEHIFNQMLPHRNAFYKFDAFIDAARSFGDFASVGDANLRKKEIAAFFAQTSHETTAGTPNGPYEYGYHYIEEQGNPDAYCQIGEWTCAPGKKYFGRGPIQLSWNYNYGPSGRSIGLDLLNNPDLVTSDPVIAFKTAMWFWMTPQPPKPSCHDVITGRWTPTGSDVAHGRLPGFGVTINIINGAIECGNRAPDKVRSRIGYYKRYCSMLETDPGMHLDCYSQSPF